MRPSPILSKVYERSMLKQMPSFSEKMSSKHQYDFREGFCTQQCLLTLKWENTIDKGKIFGVLLTNLSKAFDCLNHERIVAKLNACGFTLPDLKLIHKYLSSTKQRVPVNDLYSLWQDILFDVAQDSVWVPLLVKIV